MMDLEKSELSISIVNVKQEVIEDVAENKHEIVKNVLSEHDYIIIKEGKSHKKGR